MFRTPHEDMYMFSGAEIEEYGINRLGGDDAAAERHTSVPNVDPSKGASDVDPDRPALDEAARQPNRVVLYAGLDFYGQDVDALHVPELGDCAAACMKLGTECKAFTLGLAQPDPEPIDIGVIDPKEGVLTDTDIPFGDISPQPYTPASTVQWCRLACVQNERCQAFTFVSSRKECWLKDTVGQPRYMSGMSSGVKRPTTFTSEAIVPIGRLMATGRK